jgi:hypothetical protein
LFRKWNLNYNGSKRKNIARAGHNQKCFKKSIRSGWLKELERLEPGTVNFIEFIQQRIKNCEKDNLDETKWGSKETNYFPVDINICLKSEMEQ